MKPRTKKTPAPPLDINDPRVFEGSDGLLYFGGDDAMWIVPTRATLPTYQRRLEAKEANHANS